MKILYITSSLPVGTQETFIIPEVLSLLAQGHTITIVPVHPHGNFIHRTARHLLTHSLIVPLWSPRMIHAFLFTIRHPLLSLRAVPLLQPQPPRHFVKNLAVFFKALAIAFRIDVSSFDHIHAHWASTASSLAMALHFLSGVPWSFTAHRWDLVDGNLLPLKVASASFVRLISHNGLTLLQSHIPHLPMDKIHIIPMGVTVPGHRSLLHRHPNRLFTIMCPANLLPVKGHRYLLEAVAILKKRGVNVRLFIAGSGPLEKRIREQIISLGIKEHVEMIGRISHDRLLSFYHEGAVDAVVLPSIDLGSGTHEGIPVALIEAMAYGIPVISTKTGGIPELLNDEAGVMVPDKDATALAEAIEQMIRNPALRERIAEKGYTVVRERFAIETITHTLETLFTRHARHVS